MYNVGHHVDAPALTGQQRASYSASATLPVGTAAPGASGQATSTLERETKTSKGSKPMTAAQLAGVDGDHHEKEKKKSRFSFFGKKDKKDKDAKK